MTPALAIFPREMAHMLREIDMQTKRLGGSIWRFDHAECPTEQMVEGDYGAMISDSLTTLRAEVDATIKAAFGVSLDDINRRM